MPAALVLYVRQGCHLCAAFVEELQHVLAPHQAALTVVDVDEREEDRSRYGDKVPVLCCNGEVMCTYFFDPAVLQECLIAAQNPLD